MALNKALSFSALRCLRRVGAQAVDRISIFMRRWLRGSVRLANCDAVISFGHELGLHRLPRVGMALGCLPLLAPHPKTLIGPMISAMKAWSL